MPAISIIVPVYNVERYIDTCLNSLIGQNFEDLEIICIDDASTDHSRQILEAYAEEDSRIKVIVHEENQGTLQARKHGVEQATGRYMMFVDSDDWLTARACEQLYQIAEEKQVDMLQYGTNVIPVGNVSLEMAEWIKNFLEPYPNLLYGKEILRACFVEGKFDPNITDKFWSGDLCKRAFAILGNQRMIAAEDQYIFFVLAYYAKSYLGVCDRYFYNYNVGIGITGGSTLDLARFEKRCAGADAVKAVRSFLNIEKAGNEFDEAYKQFENRLLWDCVDCWHNKLDKQDIGSGFDILLQYWGADKITSAIARAYFENEDEINQLTAQSQIIQKKQNVGIYYRYLGYEPMWQYIDSLVQMVQKSGSNAILFTDYDSEYALLERGEEGEKRGVILLPSSKDANWDCYEERCKAFSKAIKEHQIENVIYASPTSHIAWLDMLLMRSMGIFAVYADEEAAIGRVEEYQRVKKKDNLKRNYTEEKNMFLKKLRKKICNYFD